MHLPYSDLLWNASSSLQIALQRDREKAPLDLEKGRPYNKGGAPFTGHNARVSPRVPSAVKNYVLVVVKRSERRPFVVAFSPIRRPGFRILPLVEQRRVPIAVQRSTEVSILESKRKFERPALGEILTLRKLQFDRELRVRGESVCELDIRAQCSYF